MSSRQKQKEEARAARLAAEERMRLEDRRRQRLRLLLGAGLLAVIAVVVGIVVSQSGTKASSDIPTPRQTTQLFAGIPQHGDTLGSPSARVVLEEFGDLKCPICRAYALQTLPTIVRRYVATGQVRLVFHNLLVIDRTSERAARMALAAGQQDRLWPFIDRFYALQRDESEDYVDNAFLRMVARQVPGLDVAQAMAARSSPAVSRQLAADLARAHRFGFSSTPSFLLYRAGTPPRPYLNAFDPGTLGSSIDALLRQR